MFIAPEVEGRRDDRAAKDTHRRARRRNHDDRILPRNVPLRIFIPFCPGCRIERGIPAGDMLFQLGAQHPAVRNEARKQKGRAVGKALGGNAILRGAVAEKRTVADVSMR